MKRTWQLLALLAALIAIDIGVHRTDSSNTDVLPLLGGFSASDVDELAITSVEGTVRLARSDDGWEVTHPYTHDADDALVQTIIATLSAGVQPDARVDEGDLERYGLTASQQVLVELSGVGQLVSALYVGGNAGGGVSFVRLPDDQTVYRARIGGRSRYHRPAGGWRNLQVFSFQPAAVVNIDIESGGTKVTFSRGDNGWSGAGLDGELIAALPERLGELRATRVMAPESVEGFDGRLTLTMDAGPPVVFDFATQGDIGVIRTETDGPLYQVPAALTVLLTNGQDAFADRTLLRVDLATVTELTLETPEQRSIIRRDPRTEAWVPVRPANMDIDSRRAMDAARYLATFRVMDFVQISASGAGFPGDLRMSVNQSGLEFGGPGPERSGQQTLYVRAVQDPGRIGIIDARVPVALKSAWGQ